VAGSDISAKTNKVEEKNNSDKSERNLPIDELDLFNSTVGETVQKKKVGSDKYNKSSTKKILNEL
jgi:hypothetical protein